MSSTTFIGLLKRIFKFVAKMDDFQIDTISLDQIESTDFIIKMKSGKIYKGLLLEAQFQLKKDFIDRIFLYYQEFRNHQEVTDEPRLHNRIAIFSRFLSRHTCMDYYLFDKFETWRRGAYLAKLRERGFKREL